MQCFCQASDLFAMSAHSADAPGLSKWAWGQAPANAAPGGAATYSYCSFNLHSHRGLSMSLVRAAEPDMKEVSVYIFL